MNKLFSNTILSLLRGNRCTTPRFFVTLFLRMTKRPFLVILSAVKNLAFQLFRLGQSPRRVLNNERGVAALVSIILAIIILGSVAFNFVAETRQKQSGSALTYTSTNALMIAEAGLRYTHKCLVQVDAGWGCPPILQDNSDWTTITSADNFNKDFAGDGNFAISFPGHASNDEGNIFVTSIGTFRGATRSLSRFISTVCVLGENAITSCVGTTTQNNSFVDPPLPDPPVTGECPTDPPGIVDIPALSGDCVLNCGTIDCPHFDLSTHTTGGILNSSITEFCDFKLSDSDEVKTNEADHTAIIVAGDFEITGNATLKLNDDATDPLDGTQDTVITVYGTSTMKNNGEIKVKGALTLNVDGTYQMFNSSRVNNMQGEAANASVWVEGNVTIKNSSLFVGSVSSDGTISLKNNAEIQGALFGNEVILKNNATVVYTDNEDAGSNTVGYSQCASGDVRPIWSE